ncbi:unnamed protein product [Rotaria sordida]|uniref:UBC core domain-containing protein n=1 Tax=Rotaria sordida TaxID=392033 RepID=A0A815J0F4_9BILA|nr:unnamed protein product [Rotaria sordida]CAF3885031.1 unnamed protein product [Rotaria sordida]
MAGAAPSPLNKKLWRELTDVKLLKEDNKLKQGKFIYENSSFDYSADDLPKGYAQNVIVGRLELTSNIYKNHALRIEIHLPPEYPMKPPEVVMVTPVYHPNVNEKNRLCDNRLTQTETWNNQTTLLGVLEIIVDALDNPKPEGGPVNADVAREYMQNKAEYERKATAMIQQNGVPRS